MDFLAICQSFGGRHFGKPAVCGTKHVGVTETTTRMADCVTCPRCRFILAIAGRYAAAPVTTGEAHAAYRLLARHIDARFAEAVLAGWRFIPVLDGAPPDLAACQQSRVLPVHDGDHGHPELTDAENWRFRAVHDVYGHLASGAGFDFLGEVRAAREQVRDAVAFSRKDGWTRAERWLVIRALWAEIVGQAAYAAVHGRFPLQKAVLL